MVAISFSFLFCLSQKLWEEEEMKPLSIGKQDNKFYEWFYVCSVTETENLDQICSIWQLGQVWEWKFEKLKMTTTKNRGVVGFLWLQDLAAKTKNYASSAYVSRRLRNSSDSKISGVKRLPGTQNFGSCEPMSHQTSKNFHPTLAETELLEYRPTWSIPPCGEHF